MAGCRVLLKRSVEKDLLQVPKNDLTRILHRIEALAWEPRPKGCETLSGREQDRLRQGRYRIVYSIQDHERTVWVVKIAHRKEAYR